MRAVRKRKAIGFILLTGWVIAVVVFLVVRTAEPYQIEVVGFESADYGPKLIRLRFINRTSEELEVRQTRGQIGTVCYCRPMDRPFFGRIYSTLGVSGTTGTKTHTIPPHSSVEIVDHPPIYQGKTNLVGETLVAWWHPLDLPDSLWRRARSKLALWVHRPTTAELHGHPSVGWRGRLSARIIPEPRQPVSSEPFLYER